ncbi:MAG: metallophosphoesterase [Chloroflexi bacterium]|nr:metallophosphoesterase [Chloroflexota bacterium]
MLLSEKIGVAVVLAVVVTVYAGAAVSGATVLLERSGLRRPGTRTEKRLRVALFTAAGLGTAALCYAAWVEPYWPRVTVVELHSAKIPEGHSGIRIVHVSDLHADPVVRLEGRLPGLIAAEEPDAIVFTGDAINSADGLEVFKDCFRQLSAIAPTLAVRGNWDVWYWKEVDLFGGTGAVDPGHQAAGKCPPGRLPAGLDHDRCRPGGVKIPTPL